jgi:glycosyltransferase involved in cell wall biosynthesis
MDTPLTVLFSGHDFKFLAPLVDRCRADGRFRVLVDEHPGHQITDTEKAASIGAEADLIFCEWSLGNAAWYSRMKRPDQVLIVRLHAQELRLPYLDEIEWDAVDHLICICPENLERTLARFPKLVDKTSLIYNPIDCDALDQEKLPGADFNLGLVGMVPRMKRPDLAVDLCRALREGDKRFSLCVKGKLPREYPWMLGRSDEMAYYDELLDSLAASDHANAVIFDPHGDDMESWYRKVGFILSTSDHEGSHQAVAEGMASGAIPIIRSWDGAAKLYPAEYVWDDAEGARALIAELRRPEAYASAVEHCRRYARSEFDVSRIWEQLNSLFARCLQARGTEAPSLASGPASRPAAAERCAALHVCYLQPGVESGYRTRVVKETSLLGGLGHAVTIAAFVPSGSAEDPTTIDDFRTQLADATGANIEVFPTAHFFDQALSQDARCSMVDPLVELAERVGARIVHGQAIYAGRLALEVARALPEVRSVVDLHGIAPEEHSMTGGHMARFEMLESLEGELLRDADLAVFVSQRMSRHYSGKYGAKGCNELVLPCCVQASDFADSEPARLAARDALGLGSATIVTYLGTLARWQWPEAMFTLFSDLLRHLPDLHLLLLVPEPDQAEARRWLEDLGVSADTFTLREVPAAEVGGILGVADAGLLLREPHPVNHVSSPTKFGEYMAAGVPVITTPAVGDFAAWIEPHGVGLCVEPEEARVSEPELGELVAFIRSLRKTRAERRAACRALADAELSWPSAIASLSEAYQTLACS